MLCDAVGIYNDVCVPVSGETGNWFISLGTQEEAHIWCFCIN